MSGIETIPSSVPWVVWSPLTTGDLLTAGLTGILGMAALTLAAVGLWQMRIASVARNRQLDAMLSMLDERTALLSRALETVIERTASTANTPS